VAFGLFGFLVFLFAFLYPLVKGGKPFSGFLLTAFISIALLSMITEDTIESQAGVTFVALFYCLLRFYGKKTVHHKEGMIIFVNTSQSRCD
jgi:hypothetical protein